MKNRSLVFIILFFCTLSIFPQESFVIRKTAKGIAEIIENKAEKELRYSVKDASKIYGKNQVENAIIKQSIKRSARERVFNIMKEEGMKSLLQYSNHRVGIKIANTGNSQYRRLINSNVSEYSNYSNRLKRSRIINRTTSQTDLAVKRLLITRKNQFISSKDYKKWIAQERNEKLLKKGMPKDGGVLRENMKMAMGKHYKDLGDNAAHHLVGDSPESAIAKGILEKYGIDINDPINGILLPTNKKGTLKGTLHGGRHTKRYCDEVNNRLRKARSKEECMEILDSIKEDLYKGKLELYNDHNHKINTITSSFEEV